MVSIKPYTGFAFLPHQEEGVAGRLKRENDGDGICKGGILADDMGLGKTWQTIGLLLNAPVPKTLLVAPPVLIGQWMDALKASSIGCSELISRTWKGSRDSSVFIITYDKVVRNLDLLRDVMWDRIVLDEGHFIRNARTQRALSINTLNGVRKWVLSGTPVQNGISDFKSLAKWLGYDEVSNGAKLARTIIKRRQITLLADVMPPPPDHTRVSLEYDEGEEKNLFQALVGRLNNAIDNNYPSTCILELYLRLQMFISHPQIYIDAMKRKFKDYNRPDWAYSTSKLDAFKNLLVSDNKSATLVFCHFKIEMEFVAAAAAATGYTVHFIRGGMSAAGRKFSIDDSMKLAASGKPVMVVCQIVAANCGLNLQHLTRVIFYTQHWNPAVIDQALTRSYRYGQKSEVSVFHLLVNSDEVLNIDRCMLEKHHDKRLSAMSLLPELEFPFHPDFN